MTVDGYSDDRVYTFVVGELDVEVTFTGRPAHDGRMRVTARIGSSRPLSSAEAADVTEQIRRRFIGVHVVTHSGRAD